MATKNLGFVKAIHSGATAPTNTQMLWFDTSINKHKAYNFSLLEWVLLSGQKVTTTFQQANLVDGELSITHNLGEMYITDIQVYDNNDETVSSANWKYKPTNTVSGKLILYEEIIDTWRVILGI